MGQRRILRLLHDHKTRRRLHEIHAHFLRQGLGQSDHVIAHFLSICASLKKMSYAIRVFDQSESPNMSLFNSIIKGFSVNGPFGRSLIFFSAMKRRGIKPDPYTFAPLLKACSNLRDYEAGQSVRSHVLRTGFDRFSSVRIGVIDLYVGCSRMEDAQKVFDEMYHRDVVVWNMMVRGYCKSGDVDAGLSLFGRMSERSVISWNSMISCLARSGRNSEALDIFFEMRVQRFEPDEATVVTVLPVCGRLGNIETGRWIHSYADSKGLLRDCVSVGNSLVDFYSKSGNLQRAFDIFDRMRQRDVISWNAMISGMALNGEGQRGVMLFEEMVKISRTKPNDSTFVGVLACCAHAGLVEKGRRFFDSMIEPKLEHYGCMVDILGRSGFVAEALDLIRSTPVKANAVLWGSLLGSCRTHGNLEVAEVALRELIEVEPWNSGNYVLLSNMYAEEGRWDKVEEVREVMKRRCVTKSPGQSAIGLVC